MLKPIDIVVLTDLILRPSKATWTQVELSQKLHMSQASVHRSLRQLEQSGLWRGLQVQKSAYRGLLLHAVRFVYPAELGAAARGLPTAHAGPAFMEQMSAGEPYVWPSEEGEAYGPSLQPLHPAVPAVALENRDFYELMALIDVFRVGRARECKIAEGRLSEILDTPR